MPPGDVHVTQGGPHDTKIGQEGPGGRGWGWGCLWWKRLACPKYPQYPHYPQGVWVWVGVWGWGWK